MHDDNLHFSQPKDVNPETWYNPRNQGSGLHINPEYDNSPAERLHTQTNLPPRPAGSLSFHQEQQTGYNAYYMHDAPKRKKSSPTKWITLSLLLLVLVTAVFMIVFTPEIELPASIGPSTPPVVPGMIPPMDEYFGNLPTQENTIPSAPTGTGVTLNLAPYSEGQALSLQDVYKRCSPAVVSITANYGDKYGAYSWGTGIIFTEDGYIITNAHVLEGTSSVLATTEDNREFEAKLVGIDTASDIAVLKIDAEGLPVAEFGDSSRLEVGDDVVAIGNPLGDQFRGTMTNGIISAINRDVAYAGYNMTLLQTNTAINEGNSGGPLINMHGQVIGVTNMKMSSFYSSIEGIGFAIPSVTLKSVVDALIARGYVPGRPGIGVIIGSDIPKEITEIHGLTRGLYIESVTKNSGADNGGVRKGDIITAVDGTDVYFVEEVKAITSEFKVGDYITLTIFRNGDSFDVDIELMDAAELF